MEPADIDSVTRRGLRLARFTVGYNVVECVLVVAAGLQAGLVSLVGFGIDSGVEAASAILVAGRLAARLRGGSDDVHGSVLKERRALRLIALTFFGLATYVTVDGIRSLVAGDTPRTSPVGAVILALSLVVMSVLAHQKGQVGRALDDPLILADAAETRLCLLLSVSTLIGLVLFELTGLSWLDPVAGFVIAAFAVGEGLEAWRGELLCEHCED